MAPLLFGLRRLNTTYGSVLLPGQARNFGAWVDSRVGISLGTMPVSSGRSYWPAFMSLNWVCASVTPIVTVTLLTYWCRLASVDCFQAGLRTMVIDRLGTYDEIWYGPSEIVCWSSCRLFGTYLSYSTGRADVNGIASMYRKSPAGLISVNFSVIALVAVMPEIECVFWKLAMLTAVGLWLLLAKYAFSALQYCCRPAIVAV